MSGLMAAVAASAATIASKIGQTIQRVEMTSRSSESFHGMPDDRFHYKGKPGAPRPANTYRANLHHLDVGIPMNKGLLSHVLDTKTRKSVARANSRRRAGRWPGIGDPNTVAAYHMANQPKKKKTRPSAPRRKPAEKTA